MSNQSLFDEVKANAVAADKSAAHYLTQARQRAALTRLPSFEQATVEDMERLRKEVWKLYRLISLMVVILLAIAVLGGVLCLL
ncbi:hypothetical protein [Psychrobacter sp. JB193]|uniref:hypothetical protein n=1 Tax=Psychrobacter sp. JB193 TaxID=2024406 RepID=UPI000BAB1B5B|nr:hypothetical protein [Psychrobacter sp. JB193]PAT63107.1 hypothetical protein CIK80_11185 [Psychrobacter sp. JB193]